MASSTKAKRKEARKNRMQNVKKSISIAPAVDRKERMFNLMAIARFMRREKTFFKKKQY